MNAIPFSWQSGLSTMEIAELLAYALKQPEMAKRNTVMFHNLDALSHRIKHLQRSFPIQTLHTLAIKANPLINILRFAVASGMGLEAASIEEVALARAAGCLPNRIVFDSPAKTYEEISLALNWGINLNADSLQELERIQTLIGNHDSIQSYIGLRVNPQIGLGNIDIVSVSGKYSKFGVPLNEKRNEIIAAFERFPWLNGLHVHVGSQGIAKQQLVLAVERIFELRNEIHAKLNAKRIKFIDIGGGLPWPYRAEDNTIAPEDYVAALADQVPVSLSDDVQLITEFGRTLQAGCGFTVSRVEYIKTDDGRRTVVIHVGADLFMRRVYHPKDWYHKLSVLDADGTPKQGNEQLHTIVGPLCFGGDILAENISLPSISEGDWLILHDTGAYTLSMWSRHCNRGLPLVLGYTHDPYELQILFKGENMDDIVSFWGG